MLVKFALDALVCALKPFQVFDDQVFDVVSHEAPSVFRLPKGEFHATSFS